MRAQYNGKEAIAMSFFVGNGEPPAVFEFAPGASLDVPTDVHAALISDARFSAVEPVAAASVAAVESVAGKKK